LKTHAQPLVSVITPVYNGAKYLRECIDSILAQTYENWEYLIVNNCSTDESLEIAREYERKDSRIRVFENSQHLPLLPNSNAALRKMSSSAKYCKVVHADDWLMPECLERMVELAEASPSVSIVSAYRLEENRVTLDGMQYPSHVVPGNKVCRGSLLGEFYVFGAPSNLLLRCDVVRERPDFYGAQGIHADTDACYEILRNSDFGFVHQVLTFTRRHNEAETAFARRMNSYIPANVGSVVRYGPWYLNKEEHQQRFDELMTGYYRFLASALFRGKSEEFWKYHTEQLASLGYPLQRFRLYGVWLQLISERLFHPVQTARILLSRARRAAY
jgi:glycosyltransferase involved in cell wall biosynthesis